MNEISKTQNIRLIDVFWLGPVMILSSRYPIPPVLRYTLLIGGVATILYNANNYLKQNRL